MKNKTTILQSIPSSNNFGIMLPQNWKYKGNKISYNDDMTPMGPYCTMWSLRDIRLLITTWPLMGPYSTMWPLRAT